MVRKRRQCAAMEEYERLLEEQPSFRTNQQRAEEFTARAVTSGESDRVARKLITSAGDPRGEASARASSAPS
jgi:hypothetical protein